MKYLLPRFCFGSSKIPYNEDDVPDKQRTCGTLYSELTFKKINKTPIEVINMALGRKPLEIVMAGKHQLLTKAKNWDRVFLGDIAIIQNGFAFSSEHFTKIDGVPLIRIRDIDNITTVDKYNGKYSEEFLVKKGDILIGMDGDFKVARWKGENALLNQRVCRVIPISKHYNKKFLFFCLQPFLDAIHSETSSVTVKHISSKTIEEIPLPLPPLYEQDEIVFKLEELFSDLDKAIDTLTLIQKQLKTYRQAVLKWAFEGKLTAQWRSTNQTSIETSINEIQKMREHVGIKSKYSEIRIKDYSRLLPIPNEWKWLRNEELIYYVTSGSRDWKKYYSTNGSYFIRTQNINTNKLDLSDAAYVNLPDKVEGKRSLVEKGDLLMTITGANVGKVAYVEHSIPEAYVSQSLALMKYLDKRMVKYLWYYFQSRDFGQGLINGLVYGMGRPVLSLENMKEVPVAFCSPEEQNEIVKAIDSRFSVVEKMEETINRSVNQNEILRQSILKKAFEGKLVQSNQENAHVKELLEKIKKERQLHVEAEAGKKKFGLVLTKKERNMAVELKTIIDLLKESKRPLAAKSLWQASVYRDDIDAFYAKLKELIEVGEVKELPRKGKEAFLTLTEPNENR
jgi:type I restriction enzyme S subunit